MTILNNKLLQATEEKVESQLTPKIRDAYMKLVVAGMRAAVHGGTDGLAARLKFTPDPVAACATGAVNLVMLMKSQAKGTVPPQAIPPAAMTLMLQGLDLLERAGVVKIDADELARATHIYTDRIMAVYKVTPELLKKAAGRVHQIMQDPAKMELINRKAGIVKAPGASEPTVPGTEAV